MSAIASSPACLFSRVAVRATRATRAARSVVVRASDEPTPMSSTDEPAAQAVAIPQPSMKDAFFNTMSFGGWAPETINGRVAQIAFVAGLGAELSTGESFTAQFSEHVFAIAFASGLITLASFMPNMQNSDDYKSNPETLAPGGPWTIDAERTNGRGAMVGLVSMLILEKVIGGPITGLFGGATDLLANDFYDDSFKTEVAVAAPPAAAPAAFVDFDSVVAPAAAPVVAVESADAVAAYEAAEVAEPLRVEGAADLEVEAAAMELGRQVSVAEDAAADAM